MIQTISYRKAAAPFGELLLAHSDRGLCRVMLPQGSLEAAWRSLVDSLEKRFGEVELVWDEDGVLQQVVRYLREFFTDPLRCGRFFGATDPGGTGFQRMVWDGISRIPAGSTMTYGELADLIGRKRASRSVGGACGANPLPLVVPCHRVVAAGHRLGGFGGGLDMKRRLLGMEGWKYAGNMPAELLVK